MPVLLHTASDLPPSGWEVWAPLCGVEAGLEPSRRVVGLAAALEQAVTDEVPRWRRLAADLAAESSSALAHAPTCAGNVSDLGLMLAWERLVDQWAAGPSVILCVCDDPWLFRHLAARPGVQAGKPPPRRRVEIGLALRGLLARVRVAFRCLIASLRPAPALTPGGPVMLVYGHPASRADGWDAYFGNLADYVSGLRRVVHVDAPVFRAAPLGASLHCWGRPWAAVALVVRRWRPAVSAVAPWLVRRAALREGGTGTPAMIAWQIHCQRRFLAAVRPSLVTWPWENHSWERALVAQCRRLGVFTLGYQHATIGTLETNYAGDPPEVLPDRIACTGVVSRNLLAGRAVPPERLVVAGAWRFPPLPSLHHDPAGPIFLALPADGAIAAEMLAAATTLGRLVLVREHPMTPVGFCPAGLLLRAPGPLAESGPLAAVLFAGTTVGVEAALGGIPAVRFLPATRPANDVVPAGLTVAAADADGLGAVLAAARPASTFAAERLFELVDIALWRRLVEAPT
jgi:hypothetical protein